MQQPLRKDGAHGGAGGLGAVHIGAGAAEDHGFDPHGRRRAQQSAHIARVLHVLQQDGLVKARSRLLRGDGGGKERARAVLHGRDIVKQIRRGHILRHVFQARPVLRRLLPEDTAELGSFVQGLPQKLMPVQQILPLRPAEGAVGRERAQALDHGIFSGCQPLVHRAYSSPLFSYYNNATIIQKKIERIKRRWKKHDKRPGKTPGV